MAELSGLLLVVVILALLFDFSNGWHDSANAIATVVSTRVVSPSTAVLVAGVLNVAGAFMSTAVAKMVGTGIVDPQSVTQVVVASALAGAIVWNLFTLLLGLPTSSSHALIGGLVGAALTHGGTDGRQVFRAAGGVGGHGLVSLFWLRHRPRLDGGLELDVFSGAARPRTSTLSRLHWSRPVLWPSATGRTMPRKPWASSRWRSCRPACFRRRRCHVGDRFLRPRHGTRYGGGWWRIVRTLGMRIVKLEPVHGFAAETGAAVVLLATAHIGLPVSTTHTITSTVMGVGAVKRLSAVRWGVTRRILSAWLFTLPGAAFSLLFAICSYQNWYSRFLRGRRCTIKRLPLGTLPSTHTCPLWASTICLTIARPRPVPPSSRERALSTR